MQGTLWPLITLDLNYINQNYQKLRKKAWEINKLINLPTIFNKNSFTINSKQSLINNSVNFLPSTVVYNLT